jgi:hypothetical protein
MHGAGFIVPTTMLSVVVESFASPVFGVPPQNPGNHARQIERVVDSCTARQRIEKGLRSGVSERWNTSSN